MQLWTVKEWRNIAVFPYNLKVNKVLFGLTVNMNVKILSLRLRLCLFQETLQTEKEERSA